MRDMIKIRRATIIENTEIARASRWLVLKPLDPEPLTYEPGNVLSLFIDHDGKTYRHAYTITHCDPAAHTFTLLYRVIPTGHMTPILAAKKPGDPAGFEGKYHNPIAAEISANPRAIVGIATGTGIGPLFGFAQKTLSEGSVTVPLTLYAGFREAQDICLAKEMEALAGEFSNFSWKYTLSKPGPGWTGLKGRVTESVPPLLGPLKDLHFHLVGNGAMLRDYYEALERAGVPGERISSETYFNWDGSFNEEAVRKMAFF
jgi:NAD(P)H-flavin reductase